MNENIIKIPPIYTSQYLKLSHKSKEELSKVFKILWPPLVDYGDNLVWCFLSHIFIGKEVREFILVVDDNLVTNYGLLEKVTFYGVGFSEGQIKKLFSYKDLYKGTYSNALKEQISITLGELNDLRFRKRG